MIRAGWWVLTAASASAAAGCAVTPLTNKIAVGDEAYVIVVGEAPDSNTDLFVGPAGGGMFYRLTFNRPAEALPRLSPSGTRVAFIRSPTRDQATGAELVVLDLTTMLEKMERLPQGIGRVERLGWAPDGTWLALAGSGGMFQTPAPPARLELQPVGPDRAAEADSATRETLGSPAFATVGRCPAPDGVLCVLAGPDTTRLDPGVTAAVRWGPDSLAYLIGGRLEVRPLGAGRARTPVWTGAPSNLRQPTHYPGSGERSVR